jgi:hypothetical protein
LAGPAGKSVNILDGHVKLPVPRKVKKTLEVLFKYQYFLFSALPCFAVPTKF